MKHLNKTIAGITLIFVLFNACSSQKSDEKEFLTISKEVLKDKIKGAWAAQTIGVTYGGPTEFRYKKQIIPDSVEIQWTDTMMHHSMTYSPGLYDDIYMDITFVEVMEKHGIDASADTHADAYANAKYWLWHANQQGRYNILNGIAPPNSGHWLNNPHSDDIDFQIEADFAGIMTPGMPNSAIEICDRIGHIMNSGDGYYGGVFMATMYSYAFFSSDIPSIVKNALAHIPVQSTFYKCIADVIKWHGEYPDDWQKNWELIEEKWGEDIGCPDGAKHDFNIDAKINAAYVVLGLLYGDGDLSKTMEISTRAGQDSDCNPASSGAIVGTIIGYKNIPEYWSKGLAQIENMDFKYTQTSLNKLYDISFDHALEMVVKNGGELINDEIRIKKQPTEIAPLEQNFEGYVLGETIEIGKRIGSDDPQELHFDFEGTGIVLKGKVGNSKFDHEYALTTDKQTFNGYSLQAEFYIDGKLTKTMELPLDFIVRAHELFFQYELPEGMHQLKMIIKNPKQDAYVHVWQAITYHKK